MAPTPTAKLFLVFCSTFLHHISHPTTMSDNEKTPDKKAETEAEAAARAKEVEEQAALPYNWTQTIGDLDLTITVEAKYKGKDLDVVIKKEYLKVAIKGQQPLIEVRCEAKEPLDCHP